MSARFWISMNEGWPPSVSRFPHHPVALDTISTKHISQTIQQRCSHNSLIISTTHSLKQLKADHLWGWHQCICSTGIQPLHCTRATSEIDIDIMKSFHWQNNIQQKNSGRTQSEQSTDPKTYPDNYFSDLLIYLLQGLASIHSHPIGKTLISHFIQLLVVQLSNMTWSEIKKCQ